MSLYLKCDAEGCDHIETVKELTEAQIDTPCPKCGANLLTREDYEQSASVMNLMNAMEKAGLCVALPDDYKVGDPPPEGATLINVRHHKGETVITTKCPTQE